MEINRNRIAKNTQTSNCQLLLACLVAFSVTIVNVVYAYDNNITHRALTKSAYEGSLLSENRNYLVNNFGDSFVIKIVDGKPVTIIKGKEVFEWIKEGSDFEDGGPDTNDCRASNHFHNPLKPWDQAMMTDARLTSVGSYLINVHCVKEGWKFADRRSSLTWGTEYIAPSPDGGKIEVNNQVWSWDHARFDYLRALEANDKQDRDEHFASMFRTLGHVVHLIQDGAQPAHVRNDMQSHLEITHAAFENPMKWGGSFYERYVNNHTKEERGISWAKT